MKLFSQLFNLFIASVLLLFVFNDSEARKRHLSGDQTQISSAQSGSSKSKKSKKPMQIIECRVVGVSDGDTLTCLRNKTQYKVRLLYIDAPESGQAFGKAAKKALSELVFGQNVRLETKNNDRYQRTLAEIYIDDLNVNLALVQQGMAWAYRPNTLQIYLDAEKAAKKAKLGLWLDRKPINPADWRKQQKQK